MIRMKDVCNDLNIPYETLKYYCNEGLIPNHKRDKNNHRIFDERDLAWIKGLLCLKDCGMSIKDMKTFMYYCMDGVVSIPKRKEMLKETQERLLEDLERIQRSLDYIKSKQSFYDGILSGEIEYYSNL